jgi:Na+/citrate or Na+/malate symporter
MPFTAEQEAEFKRVFAIRRRRQVILAVPFFFVFLAMIFLRERGEMFGLPATVIGPVFLVVVIGALIFSVRNWRCPACDKYLGRGMNPKFCVRCGVGLV